MKKKQKILIIALIAAIVLAIACLVAAICLKKSDKTASSSKTAATTSSVQGSDSSAATTAANGEAPGEEYVKKEYKKEYRAIASSGIKGEPDSKVKAYFYNKAKDATPELKMKNFDLLKVYEGFRIYDTTGTTNADGTKSFVLVMYVENGTARIVNYEDYDTAAERADLLTAYIKELDNHYERFAKQAKKLDGEFLLYK